MSLSTYTTMDRKVGKLPRRKYPAPQVRQTVSSMIRMVRANPLILETNAGTKDCTSEELRRKLPPSIRAYPFGNQSKNMTSDLIKVVDKDTSTFGRHYVPRALPRKMQDVLSKRTNVGGNVAQNDVFRKPQVPAPLKKQAPAKIKPQLSRRSYSAEDIPRCVLPPMNCTASHSMESLSAISPISNSRNRDHTPIKSAKVCNSTPKIAKTPSLKELSARLNKWLQSRKKLPTALKYLQTFKDQHSVNELQNVAEEIDAERNTFLDNKENTASALNITEDKNSNYIKEDNINILVETFKELKSLIQEGYDPEHCQFWLRKIKQRYGNVEELSHFWECRAALEQAGDNVNEAIECYKTAIIHGAEIHGIDESLDKLFQKFGALNLGEAIDYSPNTKSKVKNSHIICNQFKSSIIQFAILQKKMKNTVSHKTTSVVTPVRRSSRLSHIRTPNLRVSSMIEELTDDADIKFEKNKHLSVRYN